MEKERKAEREAWERGSGGKNGPRKPGKLSGKIAVEWAERKATLGEELELEEDEYQTHAVEEPSSNDSNQQAPGEASGDERNRYIQRQIPPALPSPQDDAEEHGAIAVDMRSQRPPQHHCRPDDATSKKSTNMCYSSTLYGVGEALDAPEESERRRSGAPARSAHDRASRRSQRTSARRKRKKKKKEPGEMICGWGAPGTGDTDMSSVGSLGLLSNAELEQYFQEMYSGDASSRDEAPPPASPALSTAEDASNSLEAEPTLPTTVVMESASAFLEGEEFTYKIDGMESHAQATRPSQKNGPEKMSVEEEDGKHSSFLGAIYVSEGLNDEFPGRSDVDGGHATGDDDIDLEPRAIVVGDDSEPIRLRSRGSLSQEMIVVWDRLSIGTNSIGAFDADDDLSASDISAEAGGKLYFSQWKNRVGSSECLVNLEQAVTNAKDDGFSSSGTDLDASVEDFAEDTEANLIRRRKASARKNLQVTKAIRDIEALAFMQIMEEPPMPSMSRDATDFSAPDREPHVQKKPTSLVVPNDQNVGMNVKHGHLSLEPACQGQHDQAQDVPSQASESNGETGNTNLSSQLESGPPSVAPDENNVAAVQIIAAQCSEDGTTQGRDLDNQNNSVPESSGSQQAAPAGSSFPHPHRDENPAIGKEEKGVNLNPTGLALRERYAGKLGDIDECGESQCSSLRSVLTDLAAVSERSLAHSLQTKESSGRSLISKDSSGRSLLVKDTSDRSMDAIPTKQGASQLAENNSVDGVSSRRSSLNVYDLGDIIEEEGEEDSVEKEETIFAREQRRASMDMVLTNVNEFHRSRQCRRASTGSSLDGSSASPRDIPDRGDDGSLCLADIAESRDKGNLHQHDGALNSSGAHSSKQITKRSSLIRSKIGSLQSQRSQRSIRHDSMDTSVSGLTTGSLTGIAIARRGSNLSHSGLQSDTTKFCLPAISIGNKSLEGSTISFPNTAPSKKAGRQAVLVISDETSYEKKSVPKSDGVRKMIKDAIEPNILFKTCSEEEKGDLVDVFEPSSAHAGKVVIKQGDEGNDFYVMEKGVLDVYEGDRHVCALYAGTAFGEIALLYGCPRSATLRARCDCKLWSIDRRAYRGITGQYKRKRMKVKVAFLGKVAINDKKLEDVLSTSEMTAMASATRGDVFRRGEVIIREGEEGNIFYMIESGDVDVFIKAKGDNPVVTLGSGAFFGEKALLSDDKRSATCVAKTDVKCLILMRDDFVQMLGDLRDLMDDTYRRRDSIDHADDDENGAEAGTAASCAKSLPE